MRFVDRIRSRRTNDQESRAFHPRNETKKIASLDGKEGGEGGREKNEELMIHEERSRWDVGTVTKMN